MGRAGWDCRCVSDCTLYSGLPDKL
jgi:hypothetical protein